MKELKHIFISLIIIIIWRSLWTILDVYVGDTISINIALLLIGIVVLYFSGIWKIEHI